MKNNNFILLIIFLSLFIGCNDNKINENLVDENSSKNFNLLTTNNEIVILTKTEDGYKFSNAPSQIVILNFFTASCKPCNIMFTHLNSLEQKYPKEMKVISVSLDSQISKDELKSFMKENSIFVDVLVGENNFRLSQEFGGVKSMPLFVIYDKLGSYVTHYIGAIPEEIIEADLKRIIN